MKFSSFDSGGNDKHNGVGLVEIPKIFVIQGEFLYWTLPYNGFWYNQRHRLPSWNGSTEEVAVENISYTSFKWPRWL